MDSEFNSKFGFSTKDASCIPLFEESQCNSTFTVRVPRFYLAEAQREHVCHEKLVWGTIVHTDDSDPVAAAIHGGWLRGRWGEDIDEDLLDIPTNSLVPKEGDEFLEPPEDGPLVPPPHLDMHITVVILPTLEKYPSRVRFGLKSRGWLDHDGLSYKVHSIRFVDDPSAGLDRSAKSRKMRLAEGDRAAAEEDELLLAEREWSEEVVEEPKINGKKNGRGGTRKR